MTLPSKSIHYSYSACTCMAEREFLWQYPNQCRKINTIQIRVNIIKTPLVTIEIGCCLPDTSVPTYAPLYLCQLNVHIVSLYLSYTNTLSFLCSAKMFNCTCA